MNIPVNIPQIRGELWNPLRDAFRSMLQQDGGWVREVDEEESFSHSDDKGHDIEIHRSYILSHLDSLQAKLIAHSCMMSGVFSEEEYNVIDQSVTDVPSKLWDTLMISRQSNPIWYGNFSQSLKDNELEYIVDRIEGKITETDEQRKFLQILDKNFKKFLEFDPAIILPMHGYNLLGDHHIQEVMAETTQRRRAYKFLRLLRQHPNWYQNFKEALQDRDCGDLSNWARLLDLKESDAMPFDQDVRSTHISVQQTVTTYKNESADPNIGAIKEESFAHLKIATNFPRKNKLLEPADDFKTTDKALQQNLRKAVHIASTTSERPPLAGTQEKNIKKVPIEIAVETDHIREGAHSKHSKAFFEAKAAPEGGLVVEDLLPRCLEQAEEKAKVCCHSDEAKEQYIQQHGNIVSIIGDAGIGKTAFSKTLAQKLLNESLVDFDYIFYIPIRKINFDVKTNLLRFLMKSASCSLKYTKLSERDIKEIFEKLDENPGVVIILDGLDEASLTKKNVHHVDCDSSEEASAESFIKSLLSGNLLPKAKKFVTSRPNQLYDLPVDCRPQFIVRICGLSIASQENLCRQICGEKSSDVLQYLHNHPELNAYCYVPFNCILTMSCICEGLTDINCEITFNTMTGILAYTFLQYTKSSHVREELKENFKNLETELKKLCDLAWLGHTKKIFIFGKSHLDQVGISDETTNAFLHIHLNKKLTATILEGEKQKYFPHLLWQEFFSAIHLILFMLPEQFEEEVNNFSERDWEKVIMFMFGLCNNKILKQLDTIFSTTVSKTPDCSKKYLLKSFALKLIPNQIFNNEKPQDFFRLCLLVYESQDDELRNEVAAALPSCITLSGSLHPTDVNNILYIFDGRAMLLQLNLKVEFLQDTFKLFFPEICKNENIQINWLDLNRSINDDDVCMLAANVGKLERLRIVKCGITELGVKALMDEFKTLKKAMKSLHIDNYKISDNGAHIISCILSKVEELHIHDCGITEVGVEALRNGIKKLKEPIKSLKLSYIVPELKKIYVSFNISWDFTQMEPLSISGFDFYRGAKENITTGVGVEMISELIKLRSFKVSLTVKIVKDVGRGLHALSTCAHNIKSLDLIGSDELEDSVRLISDSLKIFKDPINSLQLNSCQIADDGAKALSTCLAKIKSLHICYCDITYVGIEYISEALKQLSHPLKELDISGNKIKDEGIISFCSSLDKVERFSFENCGITEVGIRAIATALKHSQLSSLQWLQYSYNTAERERHFKVNSRQESYEHEDITGTEVEIISALIASSSTNVKYVGISDCENADVGAQAISTCLRQIEELSIDYSDLTKTGVEWIAKSLNNLHSSILSLVLSANEGIDDSAVEILSSSLTKVDALDLSDCSITKKGVKYLSDGLQNRQNSMKCLRLGRNSIGDKGADHLSSCLDKIDILEINNCGLTSAGIDILSSSINKLSHPISSLVLSRNKGIDDSAVEILSSCLTKVDALDLSDCSITERGMEYLSDAIRKRKNSISLQLGRNSIGDKGADHLSSCLDKIYSLKLNFCDITSAGVDVLSSSIDKLSHPMKLLNLDGSIIGLDAAKALARSLRNIEELNLFLCDITEAGLKILQESKGSTRLTRWNF